MVTSQKARTVGGHLLVQGDGFVQAPRCLVGGCEIVAGGECVGVVVSQDAHTVGEHLLVQGDRLAQAPRRPVGGCEIVAGDESVGVVLSQDAHTVGQHLLEQGNRLAQAPRRIVGARQVVSGGEGVGVVGPQDLLDDTQRAPERQRLVGKAQIRRVEEDMGKISHDPFTLEQGTGIALGGDGAELVDEITGLPPPPVRILTGQAVDVDPVKQIRGRVERLSPLPLVPVLAQHLPLEPVQHRHTPVGGLLNHRRLGERRQCEMCVLSGTMRICVFNRRIRACVLVRLSRVRVLFHQGVDPPCGHARLGEHGKRPDLEAGNLAQSFVDAVEGGVHGHAQRRGHVTSVGVPRNRADHLPAGVLLQALQVPLERPLLIGRSRRRLRNRQRQVPQAPGHSVRCLRVLRTRCVK